MEQYISKSAVVTEFNRLIAELIEEGEDTMFEQGRISAFEDAKLFLDTLEVKEVDLEDNIKESLAQEYVNYIFKRHDIDPESKEGQLIYYAYMHGINQCLTQLRAQKGG